MAVFMDTQTKKSQLFKILQQQNQPLSLPELLLLLGPGYAERSVRRWLSHWVKENVVEKTGQKRGSRYQALSLIMVNQKKEKTTVIFSLPSQQSIAYIKKPIFERNPIAYNRNWLNKYQPNHTYYLSEKTRKHLSMQGRRTKAQEPAGTFARKIYNRLLIDLSYHSSRLEGNTYSLLETKKLILEGIATAGKLDEEKIMILNHKEAIHHLVSNIQKIKIDYTEICTLHYLLSDGLVTNRYSGKLRDHGVRISASTYMPLENKKQLKNQLTIITEKASEIIDPFEQSFFLLVHISYLQAFADVNKRTARLSANIPLLKNNLVPLSFNDIDKDDYASSMIAIYELNEIGPLADLYYFSYIRTCLQYDTTINTINFDEVRIRFRQQRRDLIRNIIIKLLIGNELNYYLKKETKKNIPQKYQEHFIKNVKEDLEEMSPQRIAGLGITQAQLQKWLTILHSSSKAE